jgi:hypothetical protein
MRHACERSGLTAKAYAREQRISIHAFYQARKRLRALGALGSPAAAAKAKGPSGARAPFARVEIAAARQARYRVRLANGALVEWEGAAGEELGRVLAAVSQLG